MRKSGFGGLTHFLFFERKVIFMDTGNQFLGTERIGKLMGQYAIPCIISLLVGALYNIVDQMFREVVFGVGFALLLPVFFGLDGVLYSMPVSDILTFLISAIIIAKTYRGLNAEGAQNA